jgi:N,N'-diacetyllegionaminate synthase
MNKIEIIAELAQGFEGNCMKARLLIQAAAAAGADAAKFQMVYADELATSDYKYYDLFKSLEMKDEEWKDLAIYASGLGISLYTDIFGMRSLSLSEEIKIPCVKIHGTDIANEFLLKSVAESSIPKVILGAGGAYLNEIEVALNLLKNKQVVILLGFQAYPTSTEHNQISRIDILKSHINSKYSGVEIGFADHAEPTSLLRLAIATTAIGNGATVIEKHLTLGREMKMEDHESALNPDEFHEFVTIIRASATALGMAKLSDDFLMSEQEMGYRKMIRRHVVTARPLENGQILKAEDVVLKRTALEDPITDITFVYNKKVNRSICLNMPIEFSDLTN